MDGDHELGVRSKLVLMKLGFDMRDLYGDLVQAPLPPRLQSLADQLQGYAEWRDAGRDEPARG